jgi:hypothetical protein
VLAVCFVPLIPHRFVPCCMGGQHGSSFGKASSLQKQQRPSPFADALTGSKLACMHAMHGRRAAEEASQCQQEEKAELPRSDPPRHDENGRKIPFPSGRISIFILYLLVNGNRT